MQPNPSRKQSDSRQGLCRLLLSCGLPILLVLAFLGKQFVSLDSMGWSDGFSHPLMGWDHLLTMLAVGVWAAQLRGQAIWMLPLAFVGVMSLGGLAGAAGLAIPSVEGIILLSCAVFSVLITRKVRFGTRINVLIVAFFAFFHGFAHGHEISASASLISYTLGFMLATLLLHGAGILAAKLVVLSITCLLAAIFSNAALAKSAESTIGNKSEAAAAGLVHVAPFGLAAGQIGHEYFSHYLVDVSGHPAFTASVEAVGGADFAKTPLRQAGAGKFNFNGDADGLVFKKASFQALMSRKGQDRLTRDGNGCRYLGFKRYYPAINHTPGKHSLSNGVGLTSPPVAVNILAPQVFLNSRKLPIWFIEESNLQSIFANTGNPDSETLIQSMHVRICRDRCNALQFPFTRCLAPIESQCHAIGVDFDVRVGLKAGYGSERQCLGLAMTPLDLAADSFESLFL
ncbi:MAG: HupE/UreJ family protein [Methylomonas sp.]